MIRSVSLRDPTEKICGGASHIFSSGSQNSLSEFWRSWGILAQLGEHLPYKQRVIGSSPIGPIYQETEHLIALFF